jgi:hypothetical protein
VSATGATYDLESGNLAVNTVTLSSQGDMNLDGATSGTTILSGNADDEEA